VKQTVKLWITDQYRNELVMYRACSM